jgi:hypothetical protein
MNKRDLTDRISDALEGKKVDKAFLKDTDIVRLKRLKAAQAYRLEHPAITIIQLRNFLTTQFDITIQQAYNDISLLNATFGNLTTAEKNYQRYTANHLIRLGVAAALAGDYRKSKALKGLADSLVKANNLKDEEGEQMPWDEIIPKDESFSIDPEVIGIKKVPNIKEKAEKLLRQYTNEIDNPDEQ